MYLFLTHLLELTPQKYIFVVTFQAPFCPLTLFPFFCVPVLAAPRYGAKGAMSASALCSQPQQERVPVLAPHRLLGPLALCTPSASGIRHSAQHSLAWVRCLHSFSPWDPALFLSFCFLLFMVLNPALRPCANALLLAKLNSFQGRLHKSSGLVLGARPAGLDVLFSRPQSCWRTCWHELPPKRSQQDASRAAWLGGARAAVL